MKEAAAQFGTPPATGSESTACQAEGSEEQRSGKLSQGASGDGVMSPRRPWWKTRRAYISYAVCAAVLLVLFVVLLVLGLLGYLEVGGVLFFFFFFFFALACRVSARDSVNPSRNRDFMALSCRISVFSGCYCASVPLFLVLVVASVSWPLLLLTYSMAFQWGKLMGATENYPDNPVSAVSLGSCSLRHGGVKRSFGSFP